jgi:hypothetical protein
LFSSALCGLVVVARPKATFVDICESDTRCCSTNADGSTSQYYFMTTGDTINNHKTACRLEGSGDTRLVIIDSQLENDCLVRYINDGMCANRSLTYSAEYRMNTEYIRVASRGGEELGSR